MRNKRRRFNLRVVLACFISLTLGSSSASALSLESSEPLHVTPLMRFVEATRSRFVTSPIQPKPKFNGTMHRVKRDRWAFSTLLIGTN